jgi:heat shock protein HtpX
MTKPRRKDVFPPDRSLQARMLLVLLLGLAFDAALIAAIALYATSGTSKDGRWVVPVLLVFFAACAAQAHALRLRRLVALDPVRASRCAGAIEPLCLLADLKPPEVIVLRRWEPLSWASVRPFRGARVYVTQGLVDKASDEELQAVLAHELSHLANRDAVVMTLIAGPPTMVIWACQFLWQRLGYRGWCFGLTLLPWLAVSPVPLAICRLLSRQRELAADRGAAMLTGSPSAVASAMARLSGELPRIPLADLRSTGTSDLFHFLPAREYRASDVRRIWATHPPVKVRLARLAQLEAELQRRSSASAAP